MDPNATYERIKDLQVEADAGDLDAAEELHWAREDLDEWIAKGGFVPKGYQR